MAGFFRCNGVFTIRRNFGPPEFPNMITTDTGDLCTWTLLGSSNQRYMFKLLYFDIPTSPDCRDNSLKVYRSRDYSRTSLLGTLCGVLGETEMTIKGGNNFMTVVMEVNSRTVSFRGFYGYFEQQTS